MKRPSLAELKAHGTAERRTSTSAKVISSQISVIYVAMMEET